MCVSPEIAEAIRERISLRHLDAEQAALEHLADILGGWEARAALLEGRPVQLTHAQVQRLAHLLDWDGDVTQVLLAPISAEGLAHHVERWRQVGCAECAARQDDLLAAAVHLAGHRRIHRPRWRRWLHFSGR